MNWKLILFIALVGFGAFKHFNQTSVQNFNVTLQTADGNVQIKDYQIKALEPFEMHARVLSSKRYYADREADLAPVDLALGWGPMADISITNKITISQSNRWYHWRVDEFPIPRREIETHSANMHLIPSTPAIAEAIQSVPVGKMVQFTGDLVEVTHPKGWRWRSSLSRDDTGAGACELVLVKSFRML